MDVPTQNLAEINNFEEGIKTDPYLLLVPICLNKYELISGIRKHSIQ